MGMGMSMAWTTKVLVQLLLLGYVQVHAEWLTSSDGGIEQREKNQL
jgi:hypothetical protein